MGGPTPADPAPGRTARGTRLRLAAALLVVAAGLAALGVGAVHGARSIADGSTGRQAARWQLDADYWHCLTVQAHSVVRPAEPVWFDITTLDDLVILTRVLGPWATVVGRPGRARAYVTLRPAGHDGCLGLRVVALLPGPGGPGSIVKVGSGATLPGRQQELPTTPL